jgi:hypothetical protein
LLLRHSDKPPAVPDTLADVNINGMSHLFLLKMRCAAGTGLRLKQMSRAKYVSGGRVRRAVVRDNTPLSVEFKGKRATDTGRYAKLQMHILPNKASYPFASFTLDLRDSAEKILSMAPVGHQTAFSGHECLTPLYLHRIGR